MPRNKNDSTPPVIPRQDTNILNHHVKKREKCDVRSSHFSLFYNFFFFYANLCQRIGDFLLESAKLVNFTPEP